ncbi:unnamed protein product, partial [Staurois parvus]
NFSSRDLKDTQTHFTLFIFKVSISSGKTFIVHKVVEHLTFCGVWNTQGRTDHLKTRAVPEGPGCPWYLFHRLF